MALGNKRKYYMIGGKGGVGKTSCAASLAVKFANSGHPTIVISTDPAHSLSDSFSQDLSGGDPVPVEGVDSPLYALEIVPDKLKLKEDLQSSTQGGGSAGIKDLMDSMGLGAMFDQLGDLKFEELMDNPPPGMDEIVAISKVMGLLESPSYSMFSRIVFDTAPTGHTLRLLSLPDFMDSSLGKMMKLQKKLASASAAIKSVLGKQEKQLDTPDQLELLWGCTRKVRDLFHDPDAMEFIIVTIPTVMAVSESARLCRSLRKENVPTRRLLLNQVLPPSSSDCKFCAMKRKEQMNALNLVRNDPELSRLSLIDATLFDAEIRGVPALNFMGNSIWK
ncbi:ATPase ARSA1-like isoform X2 [Punica granatum]|nr:ATPase ARSA1-like isoform X2 [Punica granatum]